MTLRELYENPAAPYEEDEVTRINIDGLNRKIFGEIAGWTVSDLREWLLSYEADNEAIHRISRGLTAEMVASVCKLMTNLDLIYAAQKIRVTAHCNTTVGERDKPLVAGAAGKKPLSTAVQELYEQKVKILTEDEEPEIETDFEVKERTPEEIKKEEEYAEE